MTNAEILSWIAREIRAERERIAGNLLNMQTYFRCGDCAGHNEHDRCEVPGPFEYAAAVSGRFAIQNGRWVNL